MALGDLLVLLNNYLVAYPDIEVKCLTVESFRNNFHPDLAVLDFKEGGVKEGVDNLFVVKTVGPQQLSGRKLSLAVDTDEQVVLVIELEVQPGSAGRNDTGAENGTARIVLALVAVKENAGRSVKLGNHNAFGAVDNEGAVFGHERNLAHVHFLLLDVYYLAVLFLLHIAQLNPERGLVRGAADETLAHVELGLVKPEGIIFQNGLAVGTDNREHALDGV